MSGQGGSSHSLVLHTSLEKEREEEGKRDEEQVVGEVSHSLALHTSLEKEREEMSEGGSSHSLALHTSLEKEREEEGERDEDQVVGEERCQVREGPVTA